MKADSRLTGLGVVPAAIALILSGGVAACGPSGVATCVDNSQCQGGQACLSGKCVAIPSQQPCSSDSTCATGQTCQAGLCQAIDAGQPAAGCATSDDCSSEQTCQSNQCVWNLGNCGQNSDCATLAATPVCDTSQNLCVGCVHNSDCGQGYTCSQNQTCTVAGTGGCTSDSNCPSGQTCQNGSCTITARGCTSNATCTDSSAPVCDTSTGHCVECVSGSDCPYGDMCQSNSCVPSSSGGCTTNADCTSDQSLPVCDTSTGECVQCVRSTECASGDTCQSNTCTPSSSGGNGCEEEVKCVNNCTTSTCDDGCASNISATGKSAFNNLMDCLVSACPSSSPHDPCYTSSTACTTCLEKAQDSGGACYSQFQACVATG